jgi:protein SCO1
MRFTFIKIFSFFLLTTLLSCNETKTQDNVSLLPILGEKRLAPNGTDTLFHVVGDFSFVNQFGDTISQKNTEGKIYVADFFFATCQSICPVMSSNLTMVQREFENDNSLLILSHTVNPMHDTVEVLRQYADRFGAVKNKWHFLTGEKKKIYALAKEDYLVNALQDDGSTEGFLHSELFLLIDTKRRIRGMYDGTDSVQVKKLIEAIQLLKKENDATNSEMDHR